MIGEHNFNYDIVHTICDESQGWDKATSEGIDKASSSKRPRLGPSLPAETRKGDAQHHLSGGEAETRPPPRQTVSHPPESRSGSSHRGPGMFFTEGEGNRQQPSMRKRECSRNFNLNNFNSKKEERAVNLESFQKRLDLLVYRGGEWGGWYERVAGGDGGVGGSGGRRAEGDTTVSACFFVQNSPEGGPSFLG